MANSDTNPFITSMSTIYGLAYHVSTLKQIRKKHATRMHTFKPSLLVPKISLHMELKEYLESSIDVQLQEVESKLLQKFESVFRNIMHGFENVCPRREDDAPGATKRRHALGKVAEEAKATFNTEVRANLLECGLKSD